MFAWQATVQNEKGDTVFNPVVTVYLEDGTTLADIYSEDGTALDNPITGTPEGFVQFWADSGKYKVAGVSVGQTTEIWDVSINMEIAEAVAATAADVITTGENVGMAQLAAAQAAIYNQGPTFDTPALTFADTTMVYSGAGVIVTAGDLVRTRDGFLYEVLASGSSVYDVTNAASTPVKLGFRWSGTPAEPRCFGIASPSTADQTEKLQRVIQQPSFVFPDDLSVSVRTLYVVSNTQGDFGKATLTTLAGSPASTPMFIAEADIDNYHYRNGVLRGNRDNVSASTSDPGQGFMHGIVFSGGKNASWSRPDISDFFTDGIYVRGENVNGLYLDDPQCNSNSRQGMSVIRCGLLCVNNGTFSGSDRTPPMSGIDHEPNQDYENVNVVYTGIQTASNNLGRGIVLHNKGGDMRVSSQSFVINDNPEFSVRINGKGNTYLNFGTILSNGQISVGGKNVILSGRSATCRSFVIGEVEADAINISVDIDFIDAGLGFSSTSLSAAPFLLSAITSGKRKIRSNQIIARNSGGASTSRPAIIAGGGLDIEVDEFTPIASGDMSISGNPDNSRINVTVGSSTLTAAIRVSGSGWNIIAKKIITDTSDLVRIDSATDCNINAYWNGFGGRLVRIENSAATRNRIYAIGRNGTAIPISYSTTNVGGNILQSSFLHRATGTALIENKGSNVGKGNYPESLNDILPLPSFSAASIAAKANAVNTTDKVVGRTIWDTTNNRAMVASGTSDVSPWYVVDGSASVTPD